MANQDNRNFVNNVVDAQKDLVDTVVEQTRKYSNGNAIVNETVQKGSEWYKNLLENQKNVFNKTTEKAADMKGTVEENAGKMNEFYQNWFNTQAGWAKQVWEMNMAQLKNVYGNAASSDPMTQWQNMFNNWNGQANTWMNNMTQANNWMNMMNQWQNMNPFAQGSNPFAQGSNPFSMDSFKKAGENATGIFNQYYEMLNGNFAKWQENIKNGTAQDAYGSMINATEGMTRFFEMWMPMWKSIQEKTFNMDVYKQYMDPAKYQEVMDKFFGFMPESSREYFQNLSNMMQENMKQASAFGMNGYQQMKDMGKNMASGFNSSEMFGNALTGYNNWYSAMNEAVAPFTTMTAPNKYTKNLVEWQDITNRIAIYNIKNAELQYMVYNQGTQVMDGLAENIAAKIQNGTEVDSMMALYQEWLNISDKTFVSLFESDAYSQLMAEVSAMQLKLKKDIELQMEKFMVGVPVATRSEMDELYRTIYDLKKQVRQMEKMMEIGEDEAETAVAEEKATTTRRTKKA